MPSADGMILFEMYTMQVLIRSAFGDSARGTYVESLKAFEDVGLVRFHDRSNR